MEKYIPFDKSWIIRMGILDLINNNNKINLFLEKNYDNLSSDLKSLSKALKQWKTGEPIEVGESGTLYRFLKFASWKLGLNKKFILSGTLLSRNVCDNPEIINWPLKQLLTLDNNTSQWASASVLIGNKEMIENPPFKLKLTYEAVNAWNKDWDVKYDQTIANQVVAYLNWLKEGKMEFIPQQAEDYCFARAFNLLTAVEGEKRWPSLRGHESDRIEEMEKQLQQDHVTSKDHRIIQAISMLKRGNIKVLHPECVAKSWPQFWEFLKQAKN
jgi:hypothetical protein